MSDIPSEQDTQAEAETNTPDEKITPRAQSAIQGEIDDLSEYEGQLLEHRQRMNAIGNTQDAARADQDAQDVDKRLLEAIQRKWNVPTDKDDG